jgi:hypothetical protein
MILAHNNLTKGHVFIYRPSKKCVNYNTLEKVTEVLNNTKYALNNEINKASKILSEQNKESINSNVFKIFDYVLENLNKSILEENKENTIVIDTEFLRTNFRYFKNFSYIIKEWSYLIPYNLDDSNQIFYKKTVEGKKYRFIIYNELIFIYSYRTNKFYCLARINPKINKITSNFKIFDSNCNSFYLTLCSDILKYKKEVNFSYFKKLLGYYFEIEKEYFDLEIKVPKIFEIKSINERKQFLNNILKNSTEYLKSKPSINPNLILLE